MFGNQPNFRRPFHHNNFLLPFAFGALTGSLLYPRPYYPPYPYYPYPYYQYPYPYPYYPY